MRKIKLYIAASLNGKIAKPDGSVDWLESIPNPEHTDHGYADFYKKIDTTIQGYSTYDQIISWGIDFPYANKTNYVVTRKQDIRDTEFVKFITHDHVEFIRKLKEKKGKDIWLIGGGQVNKMLLNEGLLDEIQVFVMPIILQEGKELFGNLPKETNLSLIRSRTYSTGAVEILYAVN